MKKKYLLLILLLSSFLGGAQTREQDSLWNIYLLNYKGKIPATDTSYFTKKDKATSRSKAYSYDVTYPIGFYHVLNRYYMDGTLRLEALCDSSGASNGPCIYYCSNGNIEKKGQYKFDKQTGVWYHYNSKGEFTGTENFSPSPHEKTAALKKWVPENQSSILIWNVGYRYKLNKGIISSGHGFSFELGLNPGYLISQKLLLGAFIGRGTRDILYPTRFEKSYMNDFNADFQGTRLSGNDSILVNYMASIMNESGYFHEAITYYGIMLKLPYKYMPVVKMYTGHSQYLFKTLGSTVQLQPYTPGQTGYDSDYLDIQRKLAWGVELFLYNGHIKVRKYDFNHAIKKNWKWSYNLFALSIYVEQFNTTHTRFTYTDGIHTADVAMSSFMSPAFMAHHKKDYNIGLRLSLGSF